jgi:hypothetical protein
MFWQKCISLGINRTLNFEEAPLMTYCHCYFSHLCSCLYMYTVQVQMSSGDLVVKCRPFRVQYHELLSINPERSKKERGRESPFLTLLAGEGGSVYVIVAVSCRQDVKTMKLFPCYGILGCLFRYISKIWWSPLTRSTYTVLNVEYLKLSFYFFFYLTSKNYQPSSILLSIFSTTKKNRYKFTRLLKGGINSTLSKNFRE